MAAHKGSVVTIKETLVSLSFRPFVFFTQVSNVDMKHRSKEKKDSGRLGEKNIYNNYNYTSGKRTLQARHRAMDRRGMLENVED